MVSFGLVAGAALAGVYNWASGVYSYNRDAWMTDIQVEQAHVYQEDNLAIQMQTMKREEVRDLVNSDINQINNSLLVATLILSLAGEMLFEGQIPTDCPAFVLNAYMLCLGSAVFHLSFSILFGIFASANAYQTATDLLVLNIQPKWNHHFNRMKERKARENTAFFESHSLSSMMMPPLASRMFRSWRRIPQEEKTERRVASPTYSRLSQISQTWSNTERSFDSLPCKARSRGGRWQTKSFAVEPVEDDVEAKSEFKHEYHIGHLKLWRDLHQPWRKFSSCMFKCVARGTTNLLEACGYLAVGTLYGGYADAWAFWAIQILFTVINIMVVHFLLETRAIFTPSNAGPRLRWIMQEHPLVLACLVASGPLWCVIAAATSWVIMDRFFIPLCYGTHFLVNVYFVSQFTSDVSSESDPEAPRSAQPAARGTASAEGEESEEVACVLEASPWDSAGELEWGSLPTQPTEASPGSACAQHAAPARPHAAPEAEESPVAQRRVHKDFLPGNMLRWGTKVVACFWASALLWAVHGAWFGMDFKNRKAAVPTWGDTPPLLEVSEMTMATPSPFWRPHALVCPRNQVFITDRYHVYELRENNTEVKRYPCSVNGTIADVAATCGRHSCWPVVLVKGVPPLVLDCSTGRSSPLLQTETRAGRIATSAQGTNGVLETGDTLYATMDDKMIVQYGWSVQRGAWEPLWDIEETQRERERGVKQQSQHYQ
ncbi:unnamed protein product [Durusdinium trenchii]|uniref:Uncharacterized protein n=1 Tax=Durusdinium trenchii TaxID=1381693 RepID=A0ABP0LZ84_9DINO